VGSLVFISADIGGLGNFMGPDDGGREGGCGGAGHGDVDDEVTSNLRRQTHEQVRP
jgi:hypothetical protein